MLIEKRKHIRFSLEIPAIRQVQFGESFETTLRQISIGGCFLEWEENISIGDEFRLLVQLPNKNFLPLWGKTRYSYGEEGFGTEFIGITRFEQDLIARIINNKLNEQGLPEQIDPFTNPKEFNGEQDKLDSKILKFQQKREEILEDILSIYD